jgi:hypothetical protein
LPEERHSENKKETNCFAAPTVLGRRMKNVIPACPESFFAFLFCFVIHYSGRIPDKRE